MNFSLETALSAASPESLFDVLSEQLMQGLMQGFFYRERAGIVLLHDRSSQEGQLHRLEAFAPNDPRLAANYSEFCSLYRSIPAQDALCRECDEKYVREVYANSEGRMTGYRCHMKLHDMRRPLLVGGRVRGVLLAGQLIPNKARRLANICRAVDERADQSQRAKLKQIVRQHSLPAGAIRSKVHAFVYFGNAVQQALDELYSAKCDAAAQAAATDLSQCMASAFSSESEEVWRQSVSDILQELRTAIGGAPVIALARRKSRYRVLASAPTIQEKDQRNVPVNRVFAWPDGELSPADPPQSALMQMAELLGGHLTRAQVFRLDFPGEAQLGVSTLLFLGATGPDPLRPLLVSCCRALADRINAEQLVEAMRQQQASFRKRVAYTAHWLKTPLQLLHFHLANIARLRIDPLEMREERDRLVAKAKNQLQTALFDARILQHSGHRAAEIFDLEDLVREVVESLEPLAGSHNAHIELTTADPPHIIRASRSDMRMSLYHLLDNAIKYSYEESFVAVRVTRLSSDRIGVEITNRGIGLSESDMVHLRELGWRANVPDPIRSRPGSGLGLNQVIEAIEYWGGTLNYQSVPHGPGPHADRRRYLTTFSVSLPSKSAR